MVSKFLIIFLKKLIFLLLTGASYQNIWPQPMTYFLPPSAGDYNIQRLI
jgi:hypothetical protein